MDRKALIQEAAEVSLMEEAERRRFIYRDVEILITRGFLHITVVLNGCPVVFRTMFQEEVDNFYLASEADDNNWKRHYLSYSVHMIDGLLIPNGMSGENCAYHLFHNWLENTRIETVDVLHTYTMGLRQQFLRAIRLAHAYCHETYSRHLWRTRPRVEPPVNVVQALWMTFNQTEDMYDRDLRQWQHTRSIVGATAHKAAKSLKKSEDNWEDKRRTRAQRSIEDAVNWIISGEKEEQKPVTVTVNGQEFTVPKVHASQTVEEMQEELMRAMRGEKDYHDTMVEQYKVFHRARLEKARQEQDAALVAARQEQDARGVSDETVIVGYTPEQLAEINPNIHMRPSTRTQHAAPERERFDKYLETGVSAGWIGASGQPEKAAPLPAQPTAEGDEGTSLQEKITRRRPRLKS